MEIVRSLRAPVEPAAIFAHVATLDAYRAWMPLIHDVEPAEPVIADDGGENAPAWNVELRAKVGPFARSKRLRMVRTHLVVNELAVFERRELDGRNHSAWVLRAELTPVAEDTDARSVATRLDMTMRYDGALWAGPVLERVLDDQVRQGSDALLGLVTSHDAAS